MHAVATTSAPSAPQALPHNNAGWLLRNACADARDRLWSHPALLRLQEHKLGYDEYASTTLRLLLAYRHAECYLDGAYPGGVAGVTPHVPRTPLLSRDLEALGKTVPHARNAQWVGAKGRSAWIGIRCGLREIESNADTVARRLWRHHPELWSNAADYWRYLRSLEFKQPMLDESLEGALAGAAELNVAAKAAVDVCRMFYAYLSA